MKLYLNFLPSEYRLYEKRHIWAWTKNCKCLLFCKVIFVAHIKHCRRSAEPILWFNRFLSKLEHCIMTRAFEYLKFIFITWCVNKPADKMIICLPWNLKRSVVSFFFERNHDTAVGWLWVIQPVHRLQFAWRGVGVGDRHHF